MKCSEPSCERIGTKKGMCERHYKQILRNGRTSEPKEPISNFWAGVDKTGGPDKCWPWTRSRIKGGYGNAWTGHTPTLAHRFAWQLTNGPIPEGMDILHKCDNPPCCNPNHLWPGTDDDNIADCIAKGRKNWKRGEALPQAKLTESDISRIRELAGTMSQQKIAEQFGMTQSMISHIILRKSWKHV